MLKNFKKILGIEGVKIDISIDEIQSHPFLLSGFLHFTTFQPNVISSFSIKLVEEYSLGRGKSFKNVEYNLGEKSYNEAIILDANSSLEINFSIPFKFYLSEMDEMENDYIFLKPFIKAAKKIKNVDSKFFLKVDAIVEGSVINSILKKEIQRSLLNISK
ncbi:MAG: hypothetical protein KBA06_01615 [Saprospiraceae bacterium]|nr:hypothetical protein [Saprospiraceae bacterium]